MDSGKSSPSNLNRSYSLRLSNTNVSCIRTSLVRRNQSMSAKQIRFYRNGDRYFSGLILAVSPDRYKEFDSLLTELSLKLNLSTGAVRCVFNADDGTMITDVSDLHYGVPYVCSSSNSFRNIENGYGKLIGNNTIPVGPKMKIQNRHLQPIDNNQSFNKCENNSLKDFIKPKLVTVIRNGKPPQKKVTLLLNNKTAITLDNVLDQLSAKGSLGKVDKLHTTDGKLVRTLRDLFNDSTVFIALSTNEKFPEDGIELDPNSYRITPFREMKKPGGMVVVRRSNSLRQGMRYKDENENMSLSRMSKNRRSNIVKVNTSKVARPRSATHKNNNQNNKEELYPTSVFNSDSESARAKMNRNKSTTKKKESKIAEPLDIYNTVWVSDSVRSCTTQSFCSTLNQSGYSFVTEDSLPHSSPKNNNTQRNRTIDDSITAGIPCVRQPYRNLSLPELSNMNGIQLQDRFVRLQVEEENRELNRFINELRADLEEVHDFTHTNYDQSCPCCFENMKKIKTLLSITHSQSYAGRSKTSADIIRTNESGYDTMPNDTTVVGDEEEKHANWSFSQFSNSSSYEEDRYFKSHLLKRPREPPREIYEEDKTECCRVQ